MNMSSENMDVTRRRSPRTYGTMGILSAALSLLFLSEIFGSVAIILGAYQVKMEPDRSFGMIVVVLGIVCMLIGIYVTAYPLVYNFIFGF